MFSWMQRIVYKHVCHRSILDPPIFSILNLTAHTRVWWRWAFWLCNCAAAVEQKQAITCHSECRTCSKPGLQKTWLKISEVIWFYRRPPLLLQNYWSRVNWDAKSYIQRLYNLLVKQPCFSKYGRTSKRPHRSWLSTSQVSSMPLDDTTHPESSLFWQLLHFIHKKHGLLSALTSSCEIFCASHCSARCVPVIASERRVFPFLLHCNKWLQRMRTYSALPKSSVIRKYTMFTINIFNYLSIPTQLLKSFFNWLLVYSVCLSVKLSAVVTEYYRLREWKSPTCIWFTILRLGHLWVWCHLLPRAFLLSNTVAVRWVCTQKTRPLDKLIILNTPIVTSHFHSNSSNHFLRT